MFLLRVAFTHKESDVGSLGSEIENGSGDRLRIAQVTFVGSAYTASTHFKVYLAHLPCLFLLEAH